VPSTSARARATATSTSTSTERSTERRTIVHITPTRRRRILAGGTAAGILSAVLVFAAPLAASAHVTVTPDADAAAGGYGVLTFAFSHGCEESPTTAISIDIPEGLDSVSPTLTAGWQIAVTRENGDGMVRNVTYTADQPVVSGIRATLELGVKYAADTAGQTLVFPVVQTCETGETAWTQVAGEGEDAEDLESPAPTVAVGAAVPGDAHHGSAHGDAATDTDEDAQAQTDAAAHGAASDNRDSNSPVGVWLGAGGLVLGAAGLVTAVAALRRTRR
jgi:uncharacterized protein YcnI